MVSGPWGSRTQQARFTSTRASKRAGRRSGH